MSVFIFPKRPNTSSLVMEIFSLVMEIFSNGSTLPSETLPVSTSLSFVNTDAKYSFRISPTSCSSHSAPCSLKPCEPKPFQLSICSRLTQALRAQALPALATLPAHSSPVSQSPYTCHSAPCSLKPCEPKPLQLSLYSLLTQAQ